MRSKRYVPKAVVIALTFDYDIAILHDTNIILGEQGDTIIVTQLAD